MPPDDRVTWAIRLSRYNQCAGNFVQNRTVLLRHVGQKQFRRVNLMRVHLSSTLALLLCALGGSESADAQTLMDYFIDRDAHFAHNGCAPTACGPAAVGCEAPVVNCTPTTACVEVPSASCAAPHACRPVETTNCCGPAEQPVYQMSSCSVPSADDGCQQLPLVRCPQCGQFHFHRVSEDHHGFERMNDAFEGIHDWCGCGCFNGWCGAHTTGDMFQHYPYPPEYGGYYYFRPYNADTVYEQVAIAARWDVHPGNPYSVSMFDGVYEDFVQRFPHTDFSYQPPRLHSSGLQNLESLLKPIP